MARVESGCESAAPHKEAEPSEISQEAEEVSGVLLCGNRTLRLDREPQMSQREAASGGAGRSKVSSGAASGA